MNKTYTEGYKKYVLLILTGVYVFNFIDRQILVILQESIKAELDLSDTQLGLLTGLAFALFYVTVGLPIARLADKSNRKNIITVSLVVWSGMTAVCGLAGNFIQLLLARIGVGIGEAGASPPAHSMISDYFPKEKRATALSVYTMGIYIGILFGYLFGGWLDEFFGWRTALMVVGLPGIIYAILFFFTVREPERGMAESRQAEAEHMPSLSEVFSILWRKKSFRYIALGAGFTAFVQYGIGNWSPSLLVRVHGMQSGEIGTWLSLASGLGGALGVWIGGYGGDRLGRRDVKWYLLLPMITLLISLPFTLLLLWTDNQYVCLASMAISKICWTTYLAPCIAMAHGMVGLRMRALASAVLFLVLNLVGLGLGPLVIGALSDQLAADYGTTGLVYAMHISFVMLLLAIGCFWIGARRIKQDLGEDY